MNPSFDFLRKPLDAIFSSLGIAFDKISRLDRFAKIRQGITPINFFGRKGEAYGDDLQSEFSVVPMLQFQRHSGRTGFDLFQLRIVVGNALRKNTHGFAAFEHAEASFEGIRHCAHGFGIIFDTINGNDSALTQQPLHWPETKKLNCGNEVYLPRYRGSNHERIR